ncbi:hypothetical protein, partial [Frankia sp. AgW1.1]|uniref:hypothetical protein n=1 Tax=Frankia sp. AgW1.1 TaxID=1836971 RepID=UPI001932B42C
PPPAGRAGPPAPPPPEPTRASCELDNRAGDYSPRNPDSAYYGTIGRNTPCRISVPGAGALRLLGAGDYAFARDTAGLSVTGDLDLRIEATLANWRSGPLLITKSFDQLSWAWYVRPDGRPELVTTADGSTQLVATCDTALPRPEHGRRALRVTIDVNNGLFGRTVTFYTSDSLTGSWTQLGSAVVALGTTSIFDSTAEVRLGGAISGYEGAAHGLIHGAEIRSGIGGTVVAGVSFTAVTTDTEQFVDAQGNRWTTAGLAEIGGRDLRHTGEVATWPVTSDLADLDISVAIQSAGVMRRLGQGASPLRSTLYRALTAPAWPTAAYWPCEDDRDATSLASAMPGASGMAIAGAPGLASNSEFRCSQPLPTLSGSSWSGAVPEYSNSGEAQLWFLLKVPGAGVPSEQTLCRMWMANSTVPIWQLTVDPAGDLRLLGFNALLSAVVDTGAIAFGVNGLLLRVSIGVAQDGTGIDYLLHTLEVGATSGLFTSGTLASNTLGQCQRVDVGHERVLTDVVLGHLSVHSQIQNLFDASDELNAFSGETACARIARLCDEENIDRIIIGNPDTSVPLGYQLPKTLLELLAEAAAADGGILTEPRDFLGLSYRARTTMSAQTTAALALDYAGGQIGVFTPVDDDSQTRNDITATRVGGTSARRQQTTGPLSTAAPPLGVGRYESSAQLSLQTDAQAEQLANWLLHLGTVDDARYTGIGVDLGRATFQTNTTLAADCRDADVGDLLTVANPPAWMPPDQIAQIIQGSTETISETQHLISWNTAPAAPWNIAVYNATDSRYSTDGSTLGAAATTSATTLTINTPTGPVWGTADLPYDVFVGGERMTVTAVSGTSSPQTFTVTRAVNGVSRSHREGEDVTLARPVYYSL